MARVVFLDRDGVINKRALPHSYITKWDDFVLIDGVQEAIKQLNENNYIVYLVTNQRCVARGLATNEDIEALHEKMVKILMENGARIDKIFCCTHDEGQCNCRKPQIGLFLQAEKLTDVDKKKSWMIGDEMKDIDAGRNYGIRTIGIELQKGEADYYCKSLYEAVQKIISLEG